MTLLPEALVRFRTDLEEAIGREQAGRVRQGKHRRRIAVLAAAVVVVGTASAFASVRELVVEPPAYERVSRTVEGVRFSLSVPRSGWEKGPHERIEGSAAFRDRSLLFSKSTAGPQDAEAVIFWAGFRGGGEATPCAKVLSPATHGSTADVAAAVARAPGTKIVKGPTRVTIGGRPATHVVLTVRKDLGCDPGFFFTWRPRGPRGECWGACWLESSVGDTIKVWIVDVGGKTLFIEAQTAEAAMQAGHVDREITKIVGSIRFD
jgi:hypothetical protein